MWYHQTFNKSPLSSLAVEDSLAHLRSEAKVPKRGSVKAVPSGGGTEILCLMLLSHLLQGQEPRSSLSWGFNDDSNFSKYVLSTFICSTFYIFFKLTTKKLTLFTRQSKVLFIINSMFRANTVNTPKSVLAHHLYD